MSQCNARTTRSPHAEAHARNYLQVESGVWRHHRAQNARHTIAPIARVSGAGSVGHDGSNTMREQPAVEEDRVARADVHLQGTDGTRQVVAAR